MCFRAFLIFGETNPLLDPIASPGVVTPISEQLERVTGEEQVPLRNTPFGQFAARRLV
jgi:hypothetical protein